MQIDLKTHFIIALEIDPKFSEAHLQLALLYQDEGDNQNVEDHFNLAIVSAGDQIHKLEKRGGELIKKFADSRSGCPFSTGHPLASTLPKNLEDYSILCPALREYRDV